MAPSAKRLTVIPVPPSFVYCTAILPGPLQVAELRSIVTRELGLDDEHDAL
jgi:hypothetical protein